MLRGARVLIILCITILTDRVYLWVCCVILLGMNRVDPDSLGWDTEYIDKWVSEVYT